MADFNLYSYQEEVIERALQRENIIIWLPTGGGKTRAAVYVTKRHLETPPRRKVVVLVNKVLRFSSDSHQTGQVESRNTVQTIVLMSSTWQVHLVDQHYTKEFKPHLGHDYSVVAVSGESEEKDFFGKVVQDSDVIICTAQILYNAMMNTEETKHVELSGN